MNFDESFTLVISNEGNFTCNPKDPGNWTGGKVGIGELKGTKFGISAASYPDLDIKNITISVAKAIYKTNFWDKCKVDLLPEQIKFDVFDTAVNSGVTRAIKLLQRTVNTKEDGLLGPITLAAISKTQHELLSKKFNANRLLFITNFPKKYWDDFGKGWVNRIANNMLKG